MNGKRSAMYSSCSALGILALVGATLAQADDGRTQLSSAHYGHSDQRKQANELVRIVRENTARFRDVRVAEAASYQPLFGCVSGDEAGAMGLHYVNLALVNDGKLDPAQPEIVIYEPQSDGRLKLIGADYLVYEKDWDVKAKGAPQLMGQLLHYFGSPNRFGLESFFTLHVWAWKDNPTGTFVNWHSKVSCEEFDG
jgi:hypothetical protein